MNNYRISSFLIFAVFLIVGNFACNREKGFQGYNGTWWVNTPLDQRLGFIDGFVDCYTYGCRKGSRLCETRNDLEKSISSYYSKHHDDESMLVGQVLIRVAQSSRPMPSEGWESSELAQETGAFDNRIWLKYSAKKRLGFVEGYLNALMPQDSRMVSFPNSPKYYAEAITKQYLNSNNGQPQTDTQNSSPKQKTIAEVLWSMRTGKGP